MVCFGGQWHSWGMRPKACLHPSRIAQQNNVLAADSRRPSDPPSDPIRHRRCRIGAPATRSPDSILHAGDPWIADDDRGGLLNDAEAEALAELSARQNARRSM
jgi:hypothetical protein